MSVRLGFSVGPFFISGGSGSRRRRRHPPSGKHARFQYVSYWLFGLWAIEAEAWMLAGIFLAMWWLLWATTGAILYEVARYRSLPAWWGTVIDNTRPVWPKRKPALVAPAAAGWHPKLTR
jgi:hypothetical protein